MPVKIKKEYLQNPNILNIQEASVYTNLSTSYLYKLVAKKEVPHLRAGYKILFNKHDLDKWLESKCVVC
jgi:excisionase family DNA binding protein